MLRFCLLLYMFCFGLTVSAQENEVTEWRKWDEPMFSGQFFIASDPTILREADLYRMYYTCLDFFDEPRAMICEATSADGYVWQNIEAEGRIEGLVIRGRDGEWDEDLEGSYILRTDDQYLLYYSGYTHDNGYPAQGYPAALALATSTDGNHFERYSPDPILSPTSGWYDNDAVYSPVVFEYDGQYIMIYAGHCYTDCNSGWGVSLLAATSPDGGYTWTKRDEPVLLANPDIEWMNEGAAEPAIVANADGSFTLFFTGLHGEERVLGIAQSDSPFGPWDVHPEPILTPTPDSYDEAGVLAPFVLVENDVARMWYLAPDAEGYLRIGYAEADWPQTE